MRRPFGALAGIVLLASAVRLPFLLGFAVDDDEYYTLRNAEHLADDVMPESVRAYPVAFVATRAMLELFGRNTFGLRILPFACGVLAVFLAARIGRRLIGEHDALLAALVLALWPWHQYFSGLARYYSPLFLLALVLLHFAARLQDRWSGRDALAAGTCLMLLGFTHPTGMLAGAALIPAALGDRERVRRGWKPALLVVLALCAIGWFTPARGTIVRVLSGAGGHGYDAAHVVLGIVQNVTPALIAFAAFGALGLVSERRERFLLLASAALVPIVCVIGLAVAGLEVQPRYALVGMPAIVLAAGAGLERIVRPLLDRPALARASVAACLAAFAPSVLSNVRDGDRHDTAAAADFLRTRLAPTDVVQAEGHSLLRTALFGFERWLPPGYREADGTPHPTVLDEMPPDAVALHAIAANHLHAWFVTPANPWEAPPSKASRDCVDWLRAHGRRVARIGARRFDYHRNVIYVFEVGARRA